MKDDIYYLVYTSGLQDHSGNREWGVKHTNWFVASGPAFAESWARRLAQQSSARQRLEVIRIHGRLPVYWLAVAGKDELGRANIFAVMLWQGNPGDTEVGPGVTGLVPSAEDSTCLQQAVAALHAEMRKRDGQTHAAIGWDATHCWALLQRLPFTAPVPADPLTLAVDTGHNRSRRSAWLDWRRWALAGFIMIGCAIAICLLSKSPTTDGKLTLPPVPNAGEAAKTTPHRESTPASHHSQLPESRRDSGKRPKTEKPLRGNLFPADASADSVKNDARSEQGLQSDKESAENFPANFKK